VAALVLGSALGACGGDEERADADEPSGEFPMQVTDEKFPDRQLLANATNLELAVENVGTEQVPALTVTIYLQRNSPASPTRTARCGSSRRDTRSCVRLAKA
jgi:hypothetical protein